jgi:hypothetical protein
MQWKQTIMEKIIQTKELEQNIRFERRVKMIIDRMTSRLDAKFFRREDYSSPNSHMAS